jgi:hypothetical protein
VLPEQVVLDRQAARAKALRDRAAVRADRAQAQLQAALALVERADAIDYGGDAMMVARACDSARNVSRDLRRDRPRRIA